jgi:hypothetical protein
MGMYISVFMIGVSAAASEGHVQNCLSGMQSQFYSLQDKVCELGSTDSKVYGWLIVGRVLQAAALFTCAVSFGFTFVAGPLFLVGLVPAIALGILGTWVATQHEDLNWLPQITRPFVPGQPVGIYNASNNCWLNSGLQLLANTPAFEMRISRIPIFAQFLFSYKEARMGHQKVSCKIDSHQIRQYLSRETRGGIDPGHVQQDASELFEHLFDGVNSLYEFHHLIDGVPARNRQEPLIQIEIPRGRLPLSFRQLLNGFFDYRTDDHGRRHQLFFQQPPNDLLIQMKRFYRDRDGTEGKVTNAIEAPEMIQVPASLIRTGQAGSYCCDAFLVHHGDSPSGGHYVAYIKVNGIWWHCSDSTVIEVCKSAAMNAMKHSYILHYAKTSSP